jgi:hypothetical protein
MNHRASLPSVPQAIPLPIGLAVQGRLSADRAPVSCTAFGGGSLDTLDHTLAARVAAMATGVLADGAGLGQGAVRVA